MDRMGEMDSSSVFHFWNVPQLLWLTVAITAALVAAATYWRRNRLATPATVQASRSPGKIIYRDPPTVRVVDSQRVDRVRKVVRLTVGEHIDVLETHAGLSPRFRLTLKSIERRSEADAAHVAVEFGGTRISCGPGVEETGFNQFIVPRAAREEPRSSLFHYREHGDSLDFMRIRVRNVRADAATAELDVMQVSGHWPTA